MAPLLYSYFRSSAAYRVRIALNLKGLDVQQVPVHLLRNGGEQCQPAFRALNAQGLVPVWQEGEWQLSQSLAILEYLEETHPAVPLLPGDARSRARVRQIALAVACDIHPLNNLRVLRYLKTPLDHDEAVRQTWSQHWIAEGFAALEQMLASTSDRVAFCVGDTPTLADCCLVPQVFNARRVGVEMSAYPTLEAIDAACAALPAFQRAHPSQQPDAE